MNIEKWIKNNCTSLKNKTIAITGASGDLGKETCMILATLEANIIFLNRNEEKSQKLKDEIIKINDKCSIDFIKADFSLFESVKKACKELEKYNIDVLILNAAVYKIKREMSDIGFDNVFQTNFVSPYYLVKEVLKTMKKKKSGRIVCVSSIAHNYSKIDENDIDFKKVKKQSKVYGNSKRFLMFSLYELFKNEKDVGLSIVHPGITFTNMTSHFPKFIYYIIKYPMRFIFISNKKASLNIVAGVFKRCEYKYWIGPKYFNIWGYPQYKKVSTCKEEESKVIYRISEEIYTDIKN